MDNLENFITMLDYVLNTKRKRHIAGGILFSLSLLFGGLAATTLSIKSDDKEEENNEQRY